MTKKGREREMGQSHGQLTDRVALVTGGGRGIGRATALALAARGAKVMAVALEEDELADTARLAPIEYLAETVATADSCARIVEETRKRLGPIDILANVAGIGIPEHPIWEQDHQLFDRFLTVNLYGPFHLTRFVAREMIDRRFGRIVMVSSTAGEAGAPASAGYCTSKHGLLGLMRSVAQDVAPFNVTCNAVMPGWVNTHAAQLSAELEAQERGTSTTAVWAERAATYAANRVLEPEEIANVIAFLASDEATGVNGEAVMVALGGRW